MIYDGFNISRKTNILSFVVLFLNFWNKLHVYGLIVCDGNTNASTNIALNKPSSQSSTFVSTGYPQPSGEAYRANDGNTNPDFNAGSCSHTLVDDVPTAWWMVDFGGTFMITSVHITNRNRFPERLRNLHIDVSDTTTEGADGFLEGGKLCFYFTANNAAGGETLIFPCNPLTYGRYLRITISPNDLMKPLALCEVVAMGYPVNCSEAADITSSFPLELTSTVYDDISTNTINSMFTTSSVGATFTEIFEHSTSVIAPLSSQTFEIDSLSTILTTSSSVPSLSTSSSSSSLSSSPSSSSSSLAPTPSMSPSSCSCICDIQKYLTTNISLEQQIEHLKKELTIDKKETSSFKRKLVSADDDRMSAKSIGFIGVIVLSVVFGGIFILDAPLLYDSMKNFLSFVRKLKG